MHALLVAEAIAFVALVLAAYILRARFTKAPNWFRALYGIAVLALVAHIAWAGSAERERTEGVWAKNARTWDKLPLAVGWDKSRLDPYNEGIRAAMKTWNREVGCTLFVEAATITVVRIVSADFTPCGLPENNLGKGDVAGTWLCANGTAEIQLVRLDATDLAFKIVTHELGHVLGLDHDEGGLMTAGSLEGLDLVFVRPSRADTKALRARYCR